MTSHGEADPRGRRLLYRGAEADVSLGRWQGLEAVFKARKPLPYRLPELDMDIRRHRTIREAEMIHQAKGAGVGAPFLYGVDLRHALLVMEYIRGGRLRDLLLKADRIEADRIFSVFGRDVARLHSFGIMHGDLTTANVVERGGGLVFLDFGLSVRTTRTEDHAVDLRLIKETLSGAHSAVAQHALEALYAGYAEEAGQSRLNAVRRQLQSIERRGRYARVA